MTADRPLDVVIAGASGLIGSALTDHLRERGHRVTRLVRRPPSGADESRWDPYADQVDQSVIDAADVVVNVAGETLLANPHSRRWARRMRDSRVVTTRVLAHAIARSERPATFLAGNGSSVYGDHGGEVVTEASDSRGDALLTRITREWEDATLPARDAGARVCVVRTAPVATLANPLYRLQVPIFRLGLGARLGSGRQYFPVVSMRDWLSATTFLAEHDEVSGPVNLCCPVTPTNADYTRALAHALGRRAFLFVPAPVLRVLGGQMAPEMLNSINLRPGVLEAAGHRFRDRTVTEVITAMLGERPAR
jgi:uncharacterized protein (TIGR01777 family)